MQNFLRTTLATLLGLTIFSGLSLFALIGLVSLTSQKTSPRVRDKSILVFDLSLDIQDQQPTPRPNELLARSLRGNPVDENTIGLRTVLNTLEEAANDERIVALYLRGGPLGTPTGLANLREVREALVTFRKSGKSIVAYDVDWEEQEYYLGSVADTIAINPFGTLVMNGFNLETVFIAGALEKYGVQVQVTRVGKYKAAVEPFTRAESSPASREQNQKLINDLWAELLQPISKSRKLSVSQLQAIADQNGIMIADEALKAKLIDQLASRQAIADRLRKLADPEGASVDHDRGTGDGDDEKDFPQISLRAYSQAIADPAQQLTGVGDNRIAVLYANGEITNGTGSTGEIGGDSLAAELRKLRRDDGIKAIVLRVNSPGGSATASEVIQQEVIATQKVKPVIVSMGNVAASGGYWISTYSDRILAEPNTITGSIGVFGLLPNIKTLGNRQGITWDGVKTARYADLYTLSRPKTPQELAINQRLVDWTYEQFLTKVAESRDLPKEKVAEIAQGRVWSGKEARRLGLVDEIGGLDRAIEVAAQRAQLGDDWQVEEYPQVDNFRFQLIQRLIWQPGITAPGSGFSIDPMQQELRSLYQNLTLLQTLDDPRGIYLRLPVNLKIE